MNPAPLAVEELACTRGERPLFEGLDFELGVGEALWVRGGNGQGKTSLLRVLCGLAQPAHGRVLWQGRDIREQGPLFRQALFYAGHAAGLKDDLSACENLVYARRLSGGVCDERHAHTALAALGLAGVAHLPARVLSQGQRKRVGLARLVLDDRPPLVVLDEPFSALDAEAIGVLKALLDRHLVAGGMVVYTTHQPMALAGRRRLEIDLGVTETALPC